HYLVAAGRKEGAGQSVGRGSDDARMDAVEPAAVPPIFDASADRLAIDRPIEEASFCKGRTWPFSCLRSFSGVERSCGFTGVMTAVGIQNVTVGDVMPQFVIEREMPGAGQLSPEDLKLASQTSCSVLKDLGPQIQWVHSYVTDNKIYCLYRAPN